VHRSTGPGFGLALALIVIVGASCSSHQSSSYKPPGSLASKIVSKPDAYTAFGQSGIPTGGLTIEQAAEGVHGGVVGLQQCGWMAGQQRYWTTPISLHESNDVELEVNEFTQRSGATCFRQHLFSTPLPPLTSVRSAIPGALEFSGAKAGERFVEIYLAIGHETLEVGAGGPTITRAFVVELAKKQEGMLR
jgi:hypothetical protein